MLNYHTTSPYSTYTLSIASSKFCVKYMAHNDNLLSFPILYIGKYGRKFLIFAF